MRRPLLIASFVTLATVALAQTGGPPSANPPASPGMGAPAGNIPQAPVGHRQPRRGEVANTGPADPLKPSPEDAALDRKLKGICRGC